MDISAGIRHRQSAKKSSRTRLPSSPSDTEAENEDQSDFVTRSYSSPKLRTILLFCIAFRAALALFGQKTYFQPDEFYQSLEPAHRLVWGTGFETWEWRGSSMESMADLETQVLSAKSVDANQKLPIDQANVGAVAANNSKRSVLQRRILDSPFWRRLLLGSSRQYSAQDESSASKRVDGMLRSWVWPLIFALPYWLLKVFKLDNYGPLLVLAPRLPMILFAALTDFYTYRLAGRVLGNCYREAALFLSLTNLFHAHVLTRTLTTSAETCLTVMALYYWPLPLLDESTRWATRGRVQTKAMQLPSVLSKDQSEITSNVKTEDDQHEDNLNLSLALSATAFVLRPTNIVLWSFLGLELCFRSWTSTRKFQNVLKLAGRAIVIGTSVIAISVLADFFVIGRVYLPFLTFVTYNIVFSISEFYGSSPWHYHVTQSIPILLTTVLPYSIRPLVSSVRRAIYHSSQQNMATPSAALRSIRLGLLTKALIVTLTVWSCIPHKEWRFLHPLLPLLLLYPTRYLVDHYRPVGGGLWESPTTCAHSFLRINRRHFLYLLLSPVVPYLYLSLLHGRAQVSVASWLRSRGADQPGISVLFVMPCHSTPWMSHIHRTSSEEAAQWHFLTCEPPVHQPSIGFKPEVDAFFDDAPPNLDALIALKKTPELIVLFDNLYRSQHPGTSAKELYRVVYRNRWNGADLLQDDARRRGGIVVLEHLG